MTLTAFTFDLRFPGQRYDDETGLFHNGFRDYHPGLGRYVQSDPLGLEAGWNTFAYASANPTFKIDPLGLKDYFWVEGPNYGNTAGAMPSAPTKMSADQKHFEPSGHLSVGIGNPIKSYRTYSFGIFGTYKYGLMGKVYHDEHGGGEILFAYEVTKEQLTAIDLELRGEIGKIMPYGPLYTCRTYTRDMVHEIVKKYNLVQASNYPKASVPSASRHPR